jgi:hypothetical protein
MTVVENLQVFRVGSVEILYKIHIKNTDLAQTGSNLEALTVLTE